jgi:hypothetical protein
MNIKSTKFLAVSLVAISGFGCTEEFIEALNSSPNSNGSAYSPSQSSGASSEINRIRSLPPSQRLQAVKDMAANSYQNYQQIIDSNPQLYVGTMDELTMDNFYRKAREEGLPPSEARIEAERNFRNMKRFLNQ